MNHGFIKVAAGAPEVRVADPDRNAAGLLRMAQEAAEAGARLLVFPELALTGYTCGDLFLSEALLEAALRGLNTLLSGTAELDLLVAVGLPLVWQNKLYNCAAICHRGRLLGVVPKTAIPNYGEFYEARHFTPAPADDAQAEISLCGQTVPFGTHLLFACRELPAWKIAAEICEDVWVSVPPSCDHTAAGATVVCNLSASPEIIGKEDYRRLLMQSHSARTVCGYVFSSAGSGESTTDLVFSGHNIICENGIVLAEALPFDGSSRIVYSEIDVERLVYERRRMNTHISSSAARYREIPFSLHPSQTRLSRYVAPHPFVPSDVSERNRRCETILNIQAKGLAQRIRCAGAGKAVIGISGGLDSTLALLAAVRAMDLLERPRTDILAVTMPCFGTTKRTKNNATVLCRELGVDFRCVSIGKSVERHFADIGHDPADRNVTYENSQARERTQVLMDLANDCGGLVVGTGDLSELALGWATYNGDHMSMYGVNASVPKTLVRHMVAWCADRAAEAGQDRLASALRDVLDTPVSPELLPATETGEIAQKTEDLVGPYELHDFYLYYMLRFGFRPQKLYRLAKYALGEHYTDDILLHWLEVFLRRFFAQQFKRSCLPDGPKVGSVALSPRGDWRMPSDASADAWLAEVQALRAKS